MVLGRLCGFKNEVFNVVDVLLVDDNVTPITSCLPWQTTGEHPCSLGTSDSSGQRWHRDPFIKQLEALQDGRALLGHCCNGSGMGM